MIQTPAKDISRWQGTYTDTSEPIVMVKISGGDRGLYYDPQAANNYNQAIAHGHAFGGYHFAGGTDPIAEANFFLAGMKPWNPGEVPALDWEISHSDPVNWVNTFVTHVHEVAGAWPLVYMNLSTLRAYDWSPVLANCGLWLADWDNNPTGDINTGGRPYVMQQYNDGPNYDHDMFEGDVEQFKRYGWPSAEPTAPPAAPPPIVLPPEVAPTPTPVPEPTPTPEPPPPVEPPQVTHPIVVSNVKEANMFTAYGKAITGGLVSLVVAWLAHYGVTLNPLLHDGLASVALAVVSYALGHVVVYLTKNNV